MMTTSISYTLYSRNPKDKNSYPMLIISTIVSRDGAVLHGHTDALEAQYDFELRDLWRKWCEFKNEVSDTTERWHNHGCLGTSVTINKTWVA